MANKQDLQDLIQNILNIQENLNKDLNVVGGFDKWHAAARRARKSSLELTKLYKEYRKISIELEKQD